MRSTKKIPERKQRDEMVVVEPRGVVNTGDAEGDLTAPNDDWI